MKVILFSSAKDGTDQRLITELKPIVSEENLECHRSFVSLYRRLLLPKGESTIAVLHAVSIEELCSLYILHELLSNIHVILILPDRKDETIYEGHRLRPRFLTSVDSDLKEVGAVLNNMVKGLPVYSD